MIGVIISIIMIISLVFSVFNDTVSDVCSAALTGADEALQLSLSLCAVMALWGGVMKIAEVSRLNEKIALLLSPVVRILFRGIKRGNKAFELICLNMTANMLGLGNAATPLGLSCAKELDDGSEYSKRNISMLVVINTASIQLIPSTVAAIRAANGSSQPFDIIPAVLAASVVSVTAGCICVFAMFSGRDRTDDR